MNKSSIDRAKTDYNSKRNTAIRLTERILNGLENDKFIEQAGWANNGTMGHYVEILQELSDMIFMEGDFADDDDVDDIIDIW